MSGKVNDLEPGSCRYYFLSLLSLSAGLPSEVYPLHALDFGLPANETGQGGCSYFGWVAETAV